MSGYYDRQGMPIEMFQWAMSFEHENRVVEQTRHKGKDGEIWLSTVWLGLDHSFHPRESPLIFESMAWTIKPKKWNDVIGEIESAEELYFDRYSTEEQAKEGHKRGINTIG